MEYTDKVIGFAEKFVPLIMNREKTVTIRVGDKYSFLEEGDIIPTKNNRTKQLFGKLKIIEKKTTTFKNIPANIDGHEKYFTKETQRKSFSKFYNREIKDDDLVIMLRFQYIRSV